VSLQGLDQGGSLSPPVLIHAVAPNSRAHRDRISARSAFIRIKKITERYGSQLRKIARHVDDIVKGFDAATAEGQRLIQSHLRRYTETLDHWADAAAERMVAEVAAADQQRWRRISQEIGRGIEREIQTANVAPAMAQMKADQVRLIRSLPAGASERVNRLVTEGLAKGERAEGIAAKIYETGAVTKSRASLIATTEIGRAATTLQMARAQAAGSTSYVWRTAGDSDVRHDHKILDGQIFRWDSPPVADQRSGARAHPGCIYRCRCIAIPVIPDI
jgi:SPP1 gp7 family putative phage head morphogenesis protein